MRDRDCIILKKFLGQFPKDARILDVGCGIGENLCRLESWGYSKCTGVDISEEMVGIAREKHDQVFTVAEFESKSFECDVLLFSHVIEHLDASIFQQTLEFYLRCLRPQGHVIVLTPVLYDAFFNDVDHIKPYYPNGIATLFSSSKNSRQYRSSYQFQLVDIELRRQSLSPYWLRSRFLQDQRSKITLRLVEGFFRVLQFATGGLCSKVTGYGAVWQVRNLTAEIASRRPDSENVTALPDSLSNG